MRTNCAKGLLRRFMSEDHLNSKINGGGGEEEEEEDVELSLGLSLNGKFGVDPKAKKLTRSSSISDFTNPARGNGGYYMVPVIRSVNVVRTCSLPTETEKEWKKRKELQMLRRLEAKRKRTEKLKILKETKERNKVFVEEICGEGNGENGTIPNDPNYRQEQFFTNFNGLFRAGARGVSPSSPGSGLSASESESQQVQEMNKGSEIRSPENGQLLSECEQTVGPKSTFNGNSGCQAGIAVVINTGNAPTVITGPNEMRNMFEEMPSVFTKGDGPNGKRIEGFLYRYRKGEEVRIVCVCHGSFFSPAEFVKHAGGSDVDHPLRHIVVSSQPLV